MPESAEVLAALDLDVLRRAIWTARSDVREVYGQADGSAAPGYYAWLVSHGMREYALLRYVMRPSILQDIEETCEGATGGPPLNRFNLAYHAARPDLSDVFDLRTAEGRCDYLFWLLIHAPSEIGWWPVPNARQSRWFAAAAFPEDTGSERPFVTNLMWLLRRGDPSLQRQFDLRHADGRRTFAVWFYGKALPTLNWRHCLSADELNHLQREQSSAGGCGPLPVWAVYAWEADPDLRARYPVRDTDEAAAFRTWAGSAKAAGQRLGGGEPSPVGPVPPSGPPARHELKTGVNLVGYAYGELGIGEDVRQAARALKAAGVPCCIYDCAGTLSSPQHDRSMAELVTAKPVYTVNMFCMTGFETVATTLTEGPALLGGRTNVGFWPWELPIWPERWQIAFAFVDEVWASSTYTYQAFKGAAPEGVSVRQMNMAVTVPQPRFPDRARFGLPEQAYLFVFSFDGLSYLTRKNPLGTLQAFERAFPRGDEAAGLVIKAMNVDDTVPDWHAVVEAAARDSRIVVLDRRLERQDVIDLYAACDCFVSLHRSEGFGRGLAECMLLGKPVIATGWSGNTDFTTPDCSLPVSYKLVPVGSEAYPEGAGQWWAEPDLADAAQRMRDLVGSDETHRQIGEAARQCVKCQYAPGLVGRLYARALGLE